MYQQVRGVLLLLICGVGLAAPRVDLSRDPLRCRVIGQVEGEQVLLLHPHPKMLPGMELALVKGQEIVGWVRVREVTQEGACADLVEGTLPAPAEGLFASPLPFQVTAIDGENLHVYGSPVLRAGDLITIVRKGRPLAVGRFQGHYPRRLTPLRLASGEQVRVGDWCYLGLLPGAKDLLEFTAQRSGEGSPEVSAPQSQAAPQKPATSETVSKSPAETPQAQEVELKEVEPISTEATSKPGGKPKPPAAPTARKPESGEAQGTQPESEEPQTEPAAAPGGREEKAAEKAESESDAPAFTISPAADGTLAFNPPSPEQPPQRPPEGPFSSTIYGLSGLIRVPTADVMQDGTARVTWTSEPDYLSTSMGATASYSATVGVYPGIEVGLSVGEQGPQKVDLTANAKVLVAASEPGWPAIALGVVDLKRNSYDPTGFLVATQRSSDGRLAVTLGGASGESSGLLAGLSYRVGSAIELQGEYDTDRVNLGIAAQPVKGLWLRAADLDVGATYTASYEFPLEYPTKRRRLLDDVGPSSLEPQEAVETIQRDLAELGMESVQVWLHDEEEGKRLAIAYENRRFTLNELDGMEAVLPIAARRAPEDVAFIELGVKRLGLTVVSVETSAELYRRFMRGEASEEEFTRQLKVITLPRRRYWQKTVASTGATRLPYGRVDLEIGLGVRSLLATEHTMLSMGWHLRPEIVLPIARGLQADVRWSYPLAGPLVSDEPDKFNNDRAVLAYAFQPVKGFLAQIVGGRFPTDREGCALELAKPLGDRGMLYGVWAELDSTMGLEQGPYYVGEYRYAMPKWDAQLRLLGGRFLDNDRGWGVDLTRYFGEVQFSLGVRDTGLGSRAQASWTVPLSRRRQPKRPSTMRVRVADRLQYRQRTSLESPNSIYQAQLTANELSIGPDLIRTYLNRNRLSSDYVKSHLR